MILPKLVLIPLMTGAFTQILKFLIQSARGQVRWSTLQEYGGMPSAHTAFVISLSTVVALENGLASSAFAICAIFSLLIIRDAIGLRQFLGQHGRILNMLIRDLPDEEEKKYPRHLVERLGHTPWQACIGGIVGLVLGWLLFLWLPESW